MPIRADRGRGGGYALDKNYQLPPVNFTAREAALLDRAGAARDRAAPDAVPEDDRERGRQGARGAVDVGAARAAHARQRAAARRRAVAAGRRSRARGGRDGVVRVAHAADRLREEGVAAVAAPRADPQPRVRSPGRRCSTASISRPARTASSASTGSSKRRCSNWPREGGRLASVLPRPWARSMARGTCRDANLVMRPRAHDRAHGAAHAARARSPREGDVVSAPLSCIAATRASSTSRCSGVAPSSTRSRADHCGASGPVVHAAAGDAPAGHIALPASSRIAATATTAAAAALPVLCERHAGSRRPRHRSPPAPPWPAPAAPPLPPSTSSMPGSVSVGASSSSAPPAPPPPPPSSGRLAVAGAAAGGDRAGDRDRDARRDLQRTAATAAGPALLRR